MSRRNSLFPRPIRPELITVGDIVEAEYPEDGGVTVTKRGTVAAITAHAGVRHLLTPEGAVLSRYTPGFTTSVKYTLHMRPYEHPTLDMFDNPERIGL